MRGVGVPLVTLLGAGLPLPFQIGQLLGSGQSNANGYLATPVQDTTSPYENLCLFDSLGTSSGYNITLPNAATLSLQPNAQPWRTLNTGNTNPNAYAQNLGGEVNIGRMADAITKYTGASGYTMVVTQTAQNGAGYATIGPGGSGNSYAAGLYELQAAHHICTTGGNIRGTTGRTYTHGFIGWSFDHGEADAGTLSVETYATDQVNYHVQINSDAQGITGQGPQWWPGVIVAQTAAPTSLTNPNTTGDAQWLAAFRSPGDGVPGASGGSAGILLACALYPFTYADAGLHQDATSQVQKGEYKAQAWASWYETGSWSPVWPTAISIAANVITLTYAVPVLPLVFDPNHTAPHQSGMFSSAWSAAKGFEVYDSVQPEVIGVTNANPPVFQFASAHSITTGNTLTAQYVLMATGAASAIVNTTGTWTNVDATHASLATGSAPGAGFGSANVNSLVCKLVQITSVAIVNGNQVQITCARNPGAYAVIRYARATDATYGTNTGGFQTSAGNSFGACGLLRDSANLLSETGASLPNWAIPFSYPLFPTNPTVTGISPASGPTIGGTLVTIRGTGFMSGGGATGVTLNGKPLRTFKVLSDNIIIGYSARGTGAGAIVVSKLGGASGSLANAWTYGAMAAITSLGPFFSLAGGGTLITAHGFGFTGASSISVGGALATIQPGGTDTKVQFTTPSGTPSATAVNVTITTPAGTSTTGFATQLWYLPASIADFVQVTQDTYTVASTIGTLVDAAGLESYVSSANAFPTLVNGSPGTLTPIFNGGSPVLGNQPVLQFAAQLLQSASPNMAQPCSLVWIGASSSTTGDLFSTSNANQIPTLGYSTNNLFLNGNGFVTPPAALQAGGSCVISNLGSGTASVVADGVTLFSGGNTGTATGSNIRIGAGPQGFWASGYFAFLGRVSGGAQMPSGDQTIMHGISQAAYGTA